MNAGVQPKNEPPEPLRPAENKEVSAGTPKSPKGSEKTRSVSAGMVPKSDEEGGQPKGVLGRASAPPLGSKAAEVGKKAEIAAKPPSAQLVATIAELSEWGTAVLKELPHSNIVELIEKYVGEAQRELQNAHRSAVPEANLGISINKAKVGLGQLKGRLERLYNEMEKQEKNLFKPHLKRLPLEVRPDPKIFEEEPAKQPEIKDKAAVRRGPPPPPGSKPKPVPSYDPNELQGWREKFTKQMPFEKIDQSVGKYIEFLKTDFHAKILVDKFRKPDQGVSLDWLKKKIQETADTIKSALKAELLRINEDKGVSDGVKEKLKSWLERLPPEINPLTELSQAERKEDKAVAKGPEVDAKKAGEVSKKADEVEQDLRNWYQLHANSMKKHDNIMKEIQSKLLLQDANINDINSYIKAYRGRRALQSSQQNAPNKAYVESQTKFYNAQIEQFRKDLTELFKQLANKGADKKYLAEMIGGLPEEIRPNLDVK